MRHLLRYEKIRFVIVGGFNTGLDFALLNLFVLGFGMATLSGNAFSVAICVIISYWLNHHFVFHSKDEVNVRQFITFILVTGFSSLAIQSLIITAVSYAAQTSFSHSLLTVSAATYEVIEVNIAKALAVAVGMVWNFLFYKYVIFRGRTEDSCKMAKAAIGDE